MQQQGQERVLHQSDFEECFGTCMRGTSVGRADTFRTRGAIPEEISMTEVVEHPAVLTTLVPRLTFKTLSSASLVFVNEA